MGDVVSFLSPEVPDKHIFLAAIESLQGYLVWAAEQDGLVWFWFSLAGIDPFDERVGHRKTFRVQI